ncbi:uncharacterized protein LOC127841560 [Dreissena polymorpha]|uniref:uncharacterized protein LOC127841560 n=1 Tax=Dreissena polymorpha TaxID=45954 RepID=UPI002264B4AE|nr:uncharacterized protein LOC127841560 [Dreissena polymorpha]
MSVFKYVAIVAIALVCLIRTGSCAHNGTDHGPRPPPPPSPTRDHANTQSPDAGLSDAEIAGIVIGSVSAVAAVVGIGVAYHNWTLKAGNSKREGISNSCCACIITIGNTKPLPNLSPPSYAESTMTSPISCDTIYHSFREFPKFT